MIKAKWHFKDIPPVYETDPETGEEILVEYGHKLHYYSFELSNTRKQYAMRDEIYPEDGGDDDEESD